MRGRSLSPTQLFGSPLAQLQTAPQSSGQLHVKFGLQKVTLRNRKDLARSINFMESSSATEELDSLFCKTRSQRCSTERVYFLRLKAALNDISNVSGNLVNTGTLDRLQRTLHVPLAWVSQAAGAVLCRWSGVLDAKYYRLGTQLAP